MVTKSSVQSVLADRFVKQPSLLKNVALVIGGSVLMALCAQILIPLPFTPVPITGQTFGVLLVGAVLGAKRGAASMALYLAEGAIGLPAFAGGKAGLTVLFGPTGGYLWSYPLAAFVVGWLAQRGWDKSFRRTALAMLIGNLLIYVIALPWLALFVGWQEMLVDGFLPFIPGDTLKLLLAAGAVPTAWKLIGIHRSSQGLDGGAR